jgi:hypothetical protein
MNTCKFPARILFVAQRTPGLSPVFIIPTILTSMMTITHLFIQRQVYMVLK